MKNFYIAIDTEKDGKCYAYVLITNDCNNLWHQLKSIPNIRSATLIPKKKHAFEVVEKWNSVYKSEGRYMFDICNIAEGEKV